MDEVHRKVLRANLTYLQNNLDTLKVVSYLYQVEILDNEHVERLKAEVVESDRVDAFIRQMLPRQGPKAFPELINALRQDKQQEHVLSTLLESEKQIRKKMIEEDQDKEICSWLRKRITVSKSDTGMQLKTLLDFIVKHCPVNLQGRSLTAHDTLSYVQSILSGEVAEIQQAEESQLLNETVYIEIVEPLILPMDETNSDTSCGESLSMEKWSLDRVCDWLRKINRSDAIVALFRAENIDGFALTQLDKGELKELGVKLGDCLSIIGKRDEYLKTCIIIESFEHVETNPKAQAIKLHKDFSEAVVLTGVTIFDPRAQLVTSARSFSSKNCSTNVNVASGVDSSNTSTSNSCETVLKTTGADERESEHRENIVSSKEDELINNIPPSERLRSFDTPLDPSFKYKKDTVLSCTEVESRPGGDLLLPIHQLIMIDLSTKAGIFQFVRECVAFACACLNERANGTIHFGIKRENEDGHISTGGVIKGTRLCGDFNMYEEFFIKALSNCFCEDQIECIRSCVRSLQFIEVVPRAGADSLFVLEVDVVAKHSCCAGMAFYAKLPTEKKSTYDRLALFRVIDGKPRALVAEEIANFMSIKGSLAKQRSDQEEKANQSRCADLNVDGDLGKNLVHLLCDGEENFRGDHYRLLVINAPEDYMSDEWMRDHISFLCDIEWKAVFDFDDEARICKFVQKQDEVIKVVMSDDFSDRYDCNVSNPERLHQLQDNIRNSVNPSWVFVNGYSANDEQQLKPVQWKKSKSEGFKEAIRFFKGEIPPGRATVVFLLFSGDTSVILEAGEEFVTCFPDHWMCVAESEAVGKMWVEELQRRNCIEAGDERCVFGMSWNHVKEVVGTIQTPKMRNVCELPTSSGTPILLKPSVKNDLFDLDILSYSECENEYKMANAEQREQLMIKAEVDFYRGESASWWNFYIANQVCKREIYDDLSNIVKRTLQTKGDDCLVDKVCIYHQPGAGGTTTARQVLWNLRKLCRVGIIQNITEHQTAQQIIKLYQHEDRNPKPVLLLLDNPEEEKANLLLSELEELSKSFRKHGDLCSLVCVFLVCLRRTTFPKLSESQKDSNKFESKRVILKHDLSEREKEWFRDKAKALQSHFDRKDAFFVNPRLLISFNIMKESFDTGYIRRTVKEFISDIIDPDERKLLKYISLINAFDLDRRPLPSAAFDNMMFKLPWQSGPRYGRKAISNRWENKLSDAFRIMMNETSKLAMGYIHSMRITNPLMSKEILFVLMASSEGRESVSDIALEFLNCTSIFGVKSLAREDLLYIVKDVLKQRNRLLNGIPETDFSPLIQCIVGKESFQKAGLVLENGFNLTNDPYIAQQIARLFIKSQTWEQAVKFAKIATDLKPDSSYLWHTFGCIYERQLIEEYNKLASADRQIPVHELVPIVELGWKGLEVFGKVQCTSDEEKTSSPNNAGFFGELQMIVCLLDCLAEAECFQDHHDLRRFILDPHYVPGDLTMLADVNGRNLLEELKNLSQKVDKATNRIEDEMMQLRGDMVIDSKRKHNRCAEISLVRLKENLDIYFGEDDDYPPPGLQEIEQCQYRRRRIFRLASTNLRSIFDLRWTLSGEQTLVRIAKIALENIRTEFAEAYDYMTMISVHLALVSKDPAYLYNTNITFGAMVEWSTRLYEMRDKMSSSHLEPYLFMTMFNWPRTNTSYAIAPKQIELALRQWKEAYYKKYPRQQVEGTGKQHRKKDTTLFFLGNGSDMASIYTVLDREEIAGGVTFWRKPETMRQLQRFKGILSSGGTEVSVQLLDRQENKSNIKILTSMPILNRSWWNQEVNFVIGFSWVGPKAFDVEQIDPTLEADLSENHQCLKPEEYLAHKEFYHHTKLNELRKREQSSNHKLIDLTQKLREIKQIKDLQMTRTLTEMEIQKLKSESLCHSERRRILDTRRHLMKSRMPDFA